MDADIARRLYAVPPSGFVAARNDAAKREESKDAAARIRKLRRPTVSAWAVNLLVADAPDDVGALVDLGERLRAAQDQMRGADLRELSSERNRTVSRLVRRASALARDAGHPLAGAAEREVETTLDAAIADPDSAEAVRAGTLTKALAYSGTGFTGSASQVIPFRRPESRTKSQPGDAAKTTPGATAKSGAQPGTKPKAGAHAEPKTGTRAGAGAKTKGETKGGAKAGAKAGAKTKAGAKGDAGEAAGRRDARRRAVEKAEEDLEKEKRRRAEARAALDAARDHRESAAAERHRLRTELARAERTLTRAEDRVAKASTRVDTVESALDQARHRLTEAKAGRLTD